MLHCLQVGVFQMMEEGLQAVSNPSATFLGDRQLSKNASSAITVMIEGTRPLLLEVQALCSPVHQARAQCFCNVLVHDLVHKSLYSSRG